ncbi:MAG: hypothetical protein Q8L27_02915, partial [archaeon]|nr:hypothetical protein [archaeon]
ETKTITLEAYPRFPIRVSPNYYSFEYKIKGVYTPIQLDKLSMTIVKLKDAFGMDFDEINPESEYATVHFKNLGGHSFDNIKVQLTSEFFDYSQEFALAPGESKLFTIELNREKMSKLFAGQYVVDSKITVNELEQTATPILTFIEKPGIESTESEKGLMLVRHEMQKNNAGNTKAAVTIVETKNLFSSLFTSFNVEPDRKEYSFFHVNYVFSRELSPGDSLIVNSTTNWWILLGVILIIIMVWYFIDEYIRNKVVVNKQISLVRTKGGEFALKITLHLKARDFIEKIRILDRLPPMVKVFEKFNLDGTPFKIDERTRRLEWNIQALGAGEERTLSYIIYSKIGVVGKYELPSTSVFYEYKGRIKEANSNRAFYSNESKLN